MIYSIDSVISFVNCFLGILNQHRGIDSEPFLR